MGPRLLKLGVREVRVAVPAGAGVEAGLVVLQEEPEPQRLLRIVIGQPEARAIQGAWVGQVPPRPSTWDLWVSAVTMLEARLVRGVITAVESKRHFFAHLEIEHCGTCRVLPARPSDTVALVLRSPGAELFAYEDVLASAGELA
jgi:bifunctional DNase/RNase